MTIVVVRDLAAPPRRPEPCVQDSTRWPERAIASPASAPATP